MTEDPPYGQLVKCDCSAAADCSGADGKRALAQYKHISTSEVVEDPLHPYGTLFIVIAILSGVHFKPSAAHERGCCGREVVQVGTHSIREDVKGDAAVVGE